MHLSPRIVVETFTAACTLGCVFFYCLSLLGIASFLRFRRMQALRPAQEQPPVSILKPLKGIDPELWQSLSSHAELEYPEFELIFGVSDPGDPACEIVRRLQEKYPARQIRLLVCDRILGTNVKVSTLAQMVPQARYELFVVNDGDIRVSPDYLRRVTAPLADSNVGLVTCLYRGNSGPTFGSRLEALGISTDFAPGVLSARFLENGLHFGLGSTLAFRRTDLAAIGGFEAIVDYLADDYELGRRLSSNGRRVELSGATVATFLPAYTLGQFWKHQLRWWRTIRDARRWGYLGLLFTFGLPWAIATLIASAGAAWAWVMFATTVTLRLAVGLTTSLAVLGDWQIWRDAALLPIRDLIAPILWAAGLLGNTIHWRGDDFYLRRGRLSRLPTKAPN